MTITAEELQEFRDQQSGIIGMMMATTNARSGKMTLIESQMLRLLEFVNRVPEALSEIEELSARAERAEAELAALAAQNPVGMFMPGVEISPVKGRISYSQVFPDENGVVHESCIELFTRAAPAGVVVPDERAAFEEWLRENLKETYRLAFQWSDDDLEELVQHAKASVLDMRTAWQARAAVIEANKGAK